MTQPAQAAPPPLPPHIQRHAFDFRWDNEKVWALKLPTEYMHTSELEWHLAIQWLHTPGGRFDVSPVEIMQFPEKHRAQYERTMQSDLSYPIDIMRNKDGQWLILDGLHRLMKTLYLGRDTVTVRKVPPEMIRLIEK